MNTTQNNVKNPPATGLKNGDILVSSWGYDQTNIDFYLVLKVENGWATMVHLGSHHTEYSGQCMSGKATPNFGMVMGEPFRRKIKQSGFNGGPYVGINSYQGAWLWDGTPQTFTDSH